MTAVGIDEREMRVFYCRTLLREARIRRINGQLGFAAMLLQWAANGRRRIPPAERNLFGEVIR